MIKIFTDSTAYIPKDTQLENDITVMPMSVTINGKTHLETEISNHTFYKSIREAKMMPKSNPLTVEDIKKAFEKELIEGHTVLAILISDKVSKTYQNACTAKNKLLEKYPRANITIVDSKSGGMQEGLAVLAAAEVAKSGAWLEDVTKAADNNIHHTRFMFMPETLKYLEIGGRLKKAQAIIGSALQIIPILTAKNGEITLLESVRTKNKALNRILEIFKNDTTLYGVRKVIIHHIDAIDAAQEFANQISEISGLEATICGIGAVIGANVGPGAIGLVYETIEALPAE